MTTLSFPYINSNKIHNLHTDSVLDLKAVRKYVISLALCFTKMEFSDYLW